MSGVVVSWVLDNAAVKEHSDLIVLLVLADHAHEDGTHAYPSVRTIARRGRLARSTVQRSLRRLEGTGEIEAAGRLGSGTVIWRLPRAAACGPPAHAETATSAPGGPQDAAPGAASSTREGSILRPEPSENRPPTLGGDRAARDLRERGQCRFCGEVELYVDGQCTECGHENGVAS